MENNISNRLSLILSDKYHCFQLHYDCSPPPSLLQVDLSTLSIFNKYETETYMCSHKSGHPITAIVSYLFDSTPN